MPGLEDKKSIHQQPKSTNDSLGSDSGLENLQPNQPFVKSSNDSLGGDTGLEGMSIPQNGQPNKSFNGDGLAN
tara:strand:+ start:269 stop:487 length:219 start_codon:yes stop_codon:yes gene_type:complete